MNYQVLFQPIATLLQGRFGPRIKDRSSLVQRINLVFFRERERERETEREREREHG